MQKIISALTIMICLLLGYVQQGYAASSQVVPVYTNPTTPILLSKENPQFTIRLTANPTTGYNWLIQKYDRDMFTLTNHIYKPDSTTLIGSSGLDSWNFMANSAAFVAPQIFKIVFIYARPWDINDTSRELTVTIVTH